MDRDYILNNVDSFTSQQLYEFIVAGIVSMDDLKASGQLGKKKRDEINALIDNQNAKDDKAWNDARTKNDFDAYNDYINKFPSGTHIKEANDAINVLDDNAWNVAKTKNDINAYNDYINKFPTGKHIKEANDSIVLIEETAKNQEDNNLWEGVDQNDINSLNGYIIKYPQGIHIKEAKHKITQIQNAKEEIINKANNLLPYKLVEYIKKGVITFEELEDKSDLNEKFIKYLRDHQNDDFKGIPLELPEKQDTVTLGDTEVYFWGMPGSGKSCALGSVLATADNKGYLTEIKGGTGYGYANTLKNIFSPGEVCILPPPTSENTTQYLPIELSKKENGKEKIISVSILEVAGEIFKDFYDLKNGVEVSPTFKNLLDLMSSENRKIHFFFVDYSQQDRTDGNGIKQSDYLNAAASYFKNKNIFKKNTDAIYLVITKSDMMGNCGNKEVKEYLTGNICASLTNALKNQCKVNDINCGTLIGLSFSIGEVGLGGKLCIHDPKTSNNILDILFKKVPQKN